MSKFDEKTDELAQKEAPETPQSAGLEENVPELSPKAQKWLMVKVDVWVLSSVTITFLLSFLDKTNIANANIFGLSRDLHLQGNQYNIALSILFIAYAFFDIPATLALRSIRPHYWLPLCTFLFGIIAMCQGFVTSYGGLLAARFFLGVTEAATFSGCFYLLSQWYKRSEAQKRFSFFYSSTQLSGVFAGLLASAIGTVDGDRGYSAWRWVFIIEGAATAVIAIGLFFVLPDFPQQSKLLNPQQRAFILSRLEEDDNSELDKTPLTLGRIVRVILEPKTFLSGFFYFTLLIPGYAYAFFTPTIIRTYTTGAIHTQLLSVPPWACTWVASLAIAWMSDYFQRRLWFVIGPLLLLAVPGHAILLAVHHDSSTQYAALFLISMGVWSALPVIVCWCMMNVHGHTDRGIALGWFVGVAQFAGIPAAYLFVQSEGPEYTIGYGTCMACVLATCLFACAYATVCWLENRKILSKDAGEEQERVAGARVVNVI